MGGKPSSEVVVVADVAIRGQHQLGVRRLDHERFRVASLHLAFQFLQHGRLQRGGEQGREKNKPQIISAKGKKGIKQL